MYIYNLTFGFSWVKIQQLLQVFSHKLIAFIPNKSPQCVPNIIEVSTYIVQFCYHDNICINFSVIIIMSINTMIAKYEQV